MVSYLEKQKGRKEMGVNIVAVIPNRLGKTQEEMNENFGIFEVRDEVIPNWKIFEWKGEDYASWIITPRYVEPELGDPLWEAIRKHLYTVMDFLGADKVFYGNDVVTPSTPEEDEIGFFMPPPLEEELIELPDYEKFPNLKEVEELKGLIW